MDAPLVIGVAGALLIAFAFGGVSFAMLGESILGTVKITSMIMLVVIGASFLNFTLASAGLGRELQEMLGGLGLTPMMTILVVVGIYIVLGFFIETLSLMVVTIPIIVPLVVAQGYDPIWFGILMIVLIEMALITPPVGLNLYVINGIAPDISLKTILKGSLPFVACMVIAIILLCIFPGLATWLPDLVMGPGL